MPGFRILYIPPRKAGKISDWSGLNDPDKASWILKRAEDLGFNAVWFSPMHETSAIEKSFYGKTKGNSLYAIRNHFVLDPEFSTGSDAEDLKHYRHFVDTAKKRGVDVFADLVFNHVAADHPAVLNEENLLQKITADKAWKPILHDKEPVGISYVENGEHKTYHFLFKYEVHGVGRLKRLVPGPSEDPWTDIVSINYESPAARDFFLTGNNAYWKKQIDWYMDKVGITHFRCDAAYMLPPEVWQELISYARSKDPKAAFLAETLGAPDEKAEAMAKARHKEHPAFDLGMAANHWWNFVDHWLPHLETPMLNRLAKFGGTGSPDNHDTLHTIGGYFKEVFNSHARRDHIVAAISVRNYAVSAFVGNSVYMQLGYELCNQKQNGVFKDVAATDDWKKLVAERGADGHVLNISRRIREINDIKKKLGIENCRAEFKEVREIQDGKVAMMHIAFRNPDQPEAPPKEVVLFVNRHLENGAVEVSAEMLQGLKDKGLVGGENPVLEDVIIMYPPVTAVPAPAKKNDFKKAA